MSIPIIVLSLTRTPDRREKLEKQFKERGIESYYFFPAFDGKYITNYSMNPTISGKGYGVGRTFEKAELGIIMSHLAALKLAQMSGFEEVIILEDDVALCDDWDKRLEILKEKLPTDWDYVYLSGHSDYTKFNVYNEPTVLPAPKMVGAFSYMVNQKAYNKLINYCSSFMTTMDDMIMQLIAEFQQVRGYVYFPFMTYHDAETSLIWGETAKIHSSRTYFKNKI